MKTPSIYTSTLPGGTRLLHIREKGEVAYCGIMVDAGTRDEREPESGYAHLTEHCLFKGTEKRSNLQIIHRLEDVGGEMNAYTTKEETVVYALSLRRYLPRALELLCDMIFHSRFAPDALQKEVQVVLDEVEACQDNPAEQIMDDFEDVLFAGSPLGRNILGSSASLREVSSERLKAFVQRCYTPDQMLVFTMADLPMAKVEAWLRQYWPLQDTRVRAYTREQPPLYRPETRVRRGGYAQVHCVLGTRAYHQYHPDRYAFSLMNNVLGGSSMNSRLNLSIREKHALAYMVESQYIPYTDTGNWNVYVGCDAADADRAVALVLEEVEKMRTQPLLPSRLKQAKLQLEAQMVLASENRENWLMAVARQYMNTNRVETRQELFARLRAITAEDVQRVAQEILLPEQFSYLYFR